MAMAGYCRIWMPSFGLTAKPLFEATVGPDIKPFTWGKEHDWVFNKI